MQQVIHTKNLTKRYGKARGIEDINLGVYEGDIFGFIGPNGAGKSTTIRILLGLINLSSGSASVFGQDVKKSRIDILRRVGYMPSASSYYSGMKVKDIVAMSAKLRGLDCRREATRLYAQFDLDENRQVDDLSFGNRKKVNIVCALQHKPELLILDEPTSGLDPLVQRAFWSAVAERSRDGATVFLSSHVLDEVRHHCKHIAIIREGKIVVQDSVDNLANRSARRITLRHVEHLPLLPQGVIQQTPIEDGIILLYKGEMDALKAFLNDAQFGDITITEPDMEEIFLHYYTRAGETL